MLKSFTKIFTRVLQKHAPLKNVFIRNDKSCFACSQTLLKEKNKELQKECDSSLKSKNFKTFSELKQKWFCSSNSDFNKFYKSLVMSSNNSRKRWNLMNEIRNSTRTRSHIYSLKNVFNDYVTEPKKIANLLNYRFSKLGKFILQDETCETIEDFAGRSAKTFSISCITEFECLQCIKKLNRNKPQGPSALPPWALKDAVSVVNKHLCFIINECINNSTFPEILKTADVTPIFKKNDPEEPENYRPISITPCISKVIEILIKEQLTEYLQKKTNY